MVRMSLSVHDRPMRVQALRQKREPIGGAANQDVGDLDIPRRSMLGAVDPDAGPLQAAIRRGAAGGCGPNDQRSRLKEWDKFS
jgi:hypothetical protein